MAALLGGDRQAGLLADVAAAGPACQLADADLFIGPDFETDSERREREASAKELCRRCPALAECLAYAVAAAPRYGVWAALTADELRALKAEVA